MHPTLFHIPNHIPGLDMPVFGAGLLLALWALASAAFLGWLVWRQGFDSDTGSYAILLAVLGFVIYWLLPKMCEPDGLPIRSYGLMLLVGVVAGMMLAVRRARRVGIDPDLIFSLVFWMLIPGILCARVFYVIEYWPNYYQPGTPWSKVIGDVLNIASGGLVVYGSLLGAVAGLMIFARRHQMPILALADLMVPSLLLGLGFGRIGCLMYGCCFGGLCHHAWAITFPWNSPPHVRQVQESQAFIHGLKLAGSPGDPAVIAEVEPGSVAAASGLIAGERIVSINLEIIQSVQEAQFKLLLIPPGSEVSVATSASNVPRKWTIPQELPRSLPVQPAQILGSLNGFLLCFLLLAFDPFRRRDGDQFALALSVYPITRFLLEIIRTDERAIFGSGMTISQNISLLALVAAAGLWFTILRRPAGLTYPLLNADRQV